MSLIKDVLSKALDFISPNEAKPNQPTVKGDQEILSAIRNGGSGFDGGWIMRNKTIREKDVTFQADVVAFTSVETATAYRHQGLKTLDDGHPYIVYEFDKNGDIRLLDDPIKSQKYLQAQEIARANDQFAMLSEKLVDEAGFRGFPNISQFQVAREDAFNLLGRISEANALDFIGGRARANSITGYIHTADGDFFTITPQFLQTELSKTSLNLDKKLLPKAADNLASRAGYVRVKISNLKITKSGGWLDMQEVGERKYRIPYSAIQYSEITADGDYYFPKEFVKLVVKSWA